MMPLLHGRTTLRVMAGIVSLLGFAVMVAWYGFLEPPFLSYRSLPFEPMAAEVHAGEPIPLRVSRCSSSDEEEDYLIAARLIRLDPPPGDALQPVVLAGGGLVPISPGCVEEISSANIAPATTPPGMYSIAGHARVEGKWRTSKVLWSSLPFRVLPPRPAP